MVKSFIRESIELDSITLDGTGFASITKRVNLKAGYRHNMLAVDLFQDSIPLNGGSSQIGLVMEVGVSPYPIIPTDMNVKSTGTALGNVCQPQPMIRCCSRRVLVSEATNSP